MHLTLGGDNLPPLANHLGNFKFIGTLDGRHLAYCNNTCQFSCHYLFSLSGMTSKIALRRPAGAVLPVFLPVLIVR